MKELTVVLFAFLGGFGMFIYGMNTMADALQRSTASKMKNLLKMLTGNRILAIIVGALVTALIQSSSATTIMVVGFVNAGIMDLLQAVGVIMGANIGTTITAWIVSSSELSFYFSPDTLAPLAIGIGAMMMFFAKTKNKKNIGEMLIGFGLIFIGLQFMKGAIDPYKDSQVFKDAFILLGKNPILGILAGALITAIIQSSSASVGILQTLSMAGLVPFNAAIYIILGQNIGTTVTAMLSSIGADINAKRASIIHMLFNIIGSVLFAILSVIYFKFINVELATQTISIVQISVFHTIFNVSNTIILFPFANLLVKISKILIKDNKDVKKSIQLMHLDDRMLKTPSIAMESAIKEVVDMGEYMLESLKLTTETIITLNLDLTDEIYEREENLNKYDELITDFLLKLVNESLGDKQNFVLRNLMLTSNGFERIGDYCKGIVKLAEYSVENNIKFSEDAVEDLRVITDATIEIVADSIKVRRDLDYSLIHKMDDMEEYIDELEDKFRESHIERVTTGLCDGKAGIAFLDSISNLERISDHALKIAFCVKDELMY